MISAIAYYAPASRHKVYRKQLKEIADMIDSGAVRLPPVTDLGTLSAATVREAHRRLESGHTIGKLAATVG
jgi:NADPH:quinone reductase-like Zn-dependent oxidoreductase